jgi:hypothetical protein
MHGSLLDTNLNGVSFQSPADVDVTIVSNRWENEMEPNGSGPGSVKSVRKIPGASGITVRASTLDVDRLSGWADSAEIIDCYLTLRDGSVWSGRVLLQVGDYSTANGTVELTVQCETDWDKAAA